MTGGIEYGVYMQWILFSHKREWSTDTCYDMNEPYKRYDKWKKPERKDQLWEGSCTWNVQNSQFHGDRKWNGEQFLIGMEFI